MPDRLMVGEDMPTEATVRNDPDPVVNLDLYCTPDDFVRAYCERSEEERLLADNIFMAWQTSARCLSCGLK